MVRWRDEHGLHEERTEAPAARVADLTATLGGEPRDLEVIRPSLEDIYLGLVHAADAAAAPATPSEAPSPATQVTTTGVGA